MSDTNTNNEAEVSEVELRDDIEDLVLVVEHERFVESRGQYFCVAKSCNGCPYVEFCETEEDELEINLIPATRRSIGTADITEGVFVDSIPIEQVKGNSKQNNRWENETGYLSRRDVKIYKKILELPGDYERGEIPYILFDEDEASYYCIKQTCDDCPFDKNGCKVELQYAKNVMKVVATDVKSQEPRAFTLLSREPNWVSVFVNDGLREIKGLLRYIDLVFKEEFRINIKTDQHYFAYLDNRFFFDKTVLYEFNYLCEAHRRGHNVTKALKKQIEIFRKDYDKFLEEVKSGEVKLKNIPKLTL